MSFEKLLDKLVSVIDESNTVIIDRMTDLEMRYELMCIKPTLSYDKYYAIIKPKWDNVIKDFVSQSDMCESIFKLIFLLKLININEISDLRKLQELNPEKIKSEMLSLINSSDPKSKERLQNIIFQPLAEFIISKNADIYLDQDIVKTISNFVNLMSSRSICFIWDTLVLIFSRKYQHVIQNKNKEELANLLKDIFNEVIDKLKVIDVNVVANNFGSQLDSLVTSLTGMHSMSIESELNKMIPDKLASLKSFFIKIISYYYKNLHPVIWMQILRDMFIDFMENPPLDKDELFRFFSKHLLLNSGPFILKILQQVRPAMPLDLMKKYNLVKLTYPVMTSNQYNLILNKVVKDWDMYKIDYDKSASVGHVFIVHRADTLLKFVIKIAKPLSIVQSCWEYYALDNLFPTGSCEQQFVHNMLMSVGSELYSPNEVKNVRKAHKLYTMKYSNLYKNNDLNLKLTTVAIVDDVIVDKCWFAFAMSLAPGIPISSLIEGEETQLQNDTLYRSTLHRCLDLLVYKFFINIFQYGFYHGDLHAGNIYFSYEKRQMTLIDFGAVGHIDIYSNDENMRKLIDIFIMSIFFNYDELLDTMTELINEKCSEDTKIDLNSKEYIEFRIKLKKLKIESIFYSDEDLIRFENYKKYIFSDKRLDLEKIPEKVKSAKKIPEKVKSAKEIEKEIISPYNYIDKMKAKTTREKKEKKGEITDNTQSLPYDNNSDTTSKFTSFAQILTMITEFYAKSGVNIAIKFAEFYELLKAYILLIGVLSQTDYPEMRTSVIMEKIIYDPGNLKALLHIKAVYNMFTSYQTQKKKLDELKYKIDEIKRIKKFEQELKI